MTSCTVRFGPGSKRAKGYRRVDIVDPWTWYLPPPRRGGSGDPEDGDPGSCPTCGDPMKADGWCPVCEFLDGPAGRGASRGEYYDYLDRLIALEDEAVQRLAADWHR